MWCVNINLALVVVFIQVCNMNIICVLPNYIYYSHMKVMSLWNMIWWFSIFWLFDYFFVSVFGIGSMIYSGIEIGMFFELNMDETANCKNLFSVIRPLLQMVFVFVQMYFVFLNHKMNIYKNKFMSRIGLMHMIATNICVW